MVKKKASHAQTAMTITSDTPTLKGGEAGKLAIRTPVRTGASTDGCQFMNSQTMKAAVVAKAEAEQEVKSGRVGWMSSLMM